MLMDVHKRIQAPFIQSLKFAILTTTNEPADNAGAEDSKMNADKSTSGKHHWIIPTVLGVVAYISYVAVAVTVVLWTRHRMKKRKAKESQNAQNTSELGTNPKEPLPSAPQPPKSSSVQGYTTAMETNPTQSCSNREEVPTKSESKTERRSTKSITRILVTGHSPQSTQKSSTMSSKSSKTCSEEPSNTESQLRTNTTELTPATTESTEESPTLTDTKTYGDIFSSDLKRSVAHPTSV